MRPPAAAELRAALRSRVPGLVTTLHATPPAIVRALPGWTAALPWPMLLAAAPGLRAVVVYSDGTWMVRAEKMERRPVKVGGRGWAEAAASEMLAAMTIRSVDVPA